MYDSYEDAVDAAKSVDGCGMVAVITKRTCVAGFSYNFHFEKTAMPVGHAFHYRYDPTAVACGNVFNGKEVTL